MTSWDQMCDPDWATAVCPSCGQRYSGENEHECTGAPDEE